jgi:hypothetical protein
MPQLTGTQTGTGQSDLFTGEVQIVDLTANTTNAGISGATIEGLGGVDTIKGTAFLRSGSSGAAVTSQGIYNSKITDAGIDDDVFIGAGNSEGFNNQGTATSYGTYGGSINAGAGDDSFNFSGTAKAAQTMTGFGAAFSNINGGSSNDKMLFSGAAIGGTANGSFSTKALGILGSEVSGGGEKDTIEASAIAQTVSGNAVSFGAETSVISGNEDSDTIKITASSQGSEARSTGTTTGVTLNGGTGADSISVSATSNGNRSAGGLAIATGMDNASTITGGDGADIVNVRAEANFGGTSGGRGITYGLNRQSAVQTGADNDAVFVSATSTGSNSATAYGMYNSKSTDTGLGDDRVVVSATATAPGRAAAYGLYQSDLYSAEGNDRISVTSTTKGSSGGGVGAFQSRILAGAGNDSIQVVANERAEFDISDSLIFGEDGDDKIDVGIGSGQLNGGAGNDVAVLNYFNADTMDIMSVDGSIRISGTQNKSGAQQAWSQDIFQVESFQVGDMTYSADTLASTFSV